MYKKDHKIYICSTKCDRIPKSQPLNPQPGQADLTNCNVATPAHGLRAFPLRARPVVPRYSRREAAPRSRSHLRRRRENQERTPVPTEPGGHLVSLGAFRVRHVPITAASNEICEAGGSCSLRISSMAAFTSRMESPRAGRASCRRLGASVRLNIVAPAESSFLGLAGSRPLPLARASSTGGDIPRARTRVREANQTARLQ